MKKAFLILFLLNFFFGLASPGIIMSQTKEGFYDNNNYDLRKVPGYDPEGNILQDVDQPPSFQRPTLSTPKDVKTQYDPLASIPGAGALNQNQNKPTQANNQYQPTNDALSKLPINPLTGELNPGALQDPNKSRKKKEAEKKLREEFDEDAVYEETKFRRGYIIFFLTLPFALGASAAVASVIHVTKTLLGSVIMITGTGGLSGTNVYLDQTRLEENRLKKKEQNKTKP